MEIGVLKATVTVNIYWDMTPFSLADRYNSYVEKSTSGVFRKFGICIPEYKTSDPGRQPSYYFRVCVCMYVCMLPTRVLTLPLISAT